MNLTVNGKDVFAATGGRAFDKSLPSAVLIHGAGFDHSAWSLHSRWFAHHGFAVLVPDLPGHGRSEGPALKSIAEMADWIAALLEAAGSGSAHLIGHSMGSLIALETAARHPAKVSALGLIGTAATMTVGPDLLKAAEANNHDAIDMVSIWGLGFAAEIGGSLAPGLWMHGGAQRVLQHCAPGVLFADLGIETEPPDRHHVYRIMVVGFCGLQQVGADRHGRGRADQAERRYFRGMPRRRLQRDQ